MVLSAKKVWFEKVLLSEMTNLDTKVQELSKKYEFNNQQMYGVKVSNILRQYGDNAPKYFKIIKCTSEMQSKHKSV